jgi:aspartate 1-decarboxylase
MLSNVDKVMTTGVANVARLSCMRPRLTIRCRGAGARPQRQISCLCCWGWRTTRFSTGTPSGRSKMRERPLIKIIRAKLHGIKVTSADLDYHGSITLDPEHCEAAGIYPLEFVEIWNKNSGSRISTYVIYGVRGSRCCILNGAAARTCQVGDQLIIAASEYIDRMALGDFDPVVLTFHSDNAIDEQLIYRVRPTAAAKYAFSIEPRQSPPRHNGDGASAPDKIRRV